MIASLVVSTQPAGTRTTRTVCSISLNMASTIRPCNQWLPLSTFVFHANVLMSLLRTSNLLPHRSFLCGPMSVASSLRRRTRRSSCAHSSATTGPPAWAASTSKSVPTTSSQPRAAAGVRPRQLTISCPTSRYHSFDPCVSPPKRRSGRPKRDGVNGWLWRTGWWGPGVPGKGKGLLVMRHDHFPIYFQSLSFLWAKRRGSFRRCRLLSRVGSMHLCTIPSFTSFIHFRIQCPPIIPR